MFVKLNERVYLNLSRITRTKIDHLKDASKWFEELINPLNK
ncbi:MAG: hypothetical protein U5K55_11850 [Aliarcobacter sp.]|nr:hypothetical protein [Aliarcobacter sp.]